MPLCYTLGVQAGGWAHCKLAQSLLCLLPPPNCVISWFFSVNGFYFNFKALSVLSCSASFFFRCFAWLCLWSRIGLGSRMFLEKETAFPDFCILHLSSQLPKGPLSWPAGSLRDGKTYLLLQPPITIMMNVFAYFPTLWYYTKTRHKDFLITRGVPCSKVSVCQLFKLSGVKGYRAPSTCSHT